MTDKHECALKSGFFQQSRQQDVTFLDSLTPLTSELKRTCAELGARVPLVWPSEGPSPAAGPDVQTITNNTSLSNFLLTSPRTEFRSS